MAELTLRKYGVTSFKYLTSSLTWGPVFFSTRTASSCVASLTQKDGFVTSKNVDLRKSPLKTLVLIRTHMLLYVFITLGKNGTRIRNLCSERYEHLEANCVLAFHTTETTIY
jgi:hypothetical protein